MNEELEKKNAELKARIEKQNADILALKSLTERQRLRIEVLEGQTPWKDINDKSELIKENAELKEELQKWKDEWQEQVQKATDESYARTLQTIQLTKAKDIIKKFLLWENDWHDKTESKYELLKQAEQFIKDSEVEK